MRCRLLAATADPHPFRWAAIEEEPKVMRRCLTRAHRTMEYEILHTGGFVRLCTERGRVYWLAQNEHEHRLPDWKLHFSVLPRDVPRAWDVLSRLFVAEACDFGMKAVAAEALATWPAKQRGRELTVYIFQHCAAYADGGPMMECCDPRSEHRFWLGPEFERSGAFWRAFVLKAESMLEEAGVESHGGAATGDLPLGRYASLRNEAFVPGFEDALDGLRGPPAFVYPPNEAGWNAAQHAPPMPIPVLGRCWAAAVRARSLAWLGCLRRA